MFCPEAAHRLPPCLPHSKAVGQSLHSAQDKDSIRNAVRRLSLAEPPVSSGISMLARSAAKGMGIVDTPDNLRLARGMTADDGVDAAALRRSLQLRWSFYISRACDSESSKKVLIQPLCQTRCGRISTWRCARLAASFSLCQDVCLQQIICVLGIQRSKPPEMRGQRSSAPGFSPVGDGLWSRARKFPALVNCTTIDW